MIGAHEIGNSFGIKAIVFLFTAVNCLHIIGVAEIEGNVGDSAGVCKPIIAVHGFNANGKAW